MTSASEHPPRVLVMRAKGQASALADALQALGAEPVLIPVLEIVPPESYVALDHAIELCLARSHPRSASPPQWLLFTSANAVEHFVARSRSLGLTGPLLESCSTGRDAMRLAAIGPGTARSLAQYGLVASVNEVLQPPVAVAESLLRTLLPFARQPDGRPAHFLLVRAERAREVLPDGLRSAGAEVTIAPAYRTLAPKDSVSALQGLFAHTAGVEAIGFTSSSSVTNLLDLCDIARVQLPLSVLRVSIGPITSETLRAQGLPPHAEAPEANVQSLAETILRALKDYRW